MWAHSRAIEWINWPEWLSGPVAPILLYFYDWRAVILWVLVSTYLWRFFIAPRFISAFLADLGRLFVQTKILVCPIVAFLIWQKGNLWIALLALGWLAIISVLHLLLMPIDGILGAFLPFINQSMQIGPVQRRFMAELGYVRRDI
jgi:hypothetical protein